MIIQVHGEGTQPYKHVHILPQTPLPSRLPRDTEQGFLALDYPEVLVGDPF